MSTAVLGRTLARFGAMALAHRLVGMAPLSLRYFKEMAYRGVDINKAGLASMTRNICDMLLKSEDAMKGPKAFAEKRQVQWKGR